MQDLNLELKQLLDELTQLRRECLASELEFRDTITTARAEHRPSVRNLVHYLAMRNHDLRELQQRLAALGLSSLGRIEANALAGLEAVIGILRSLLRGHPFSNEEQPPPVDFASGPATLRANSVRLLGESPGGRSVRIMVTMPAEAALSYELVRNLVSSGMDIMRINCSHDSGREWLGMVKNLRRANSELGMHCKALMELAGPKARTGQIRRGYHVVHWKVCRDVGGLTIEPARIVLVASHTKASLSPDREVTLPVPKAFLNAAELGDHIRVEDSRGKARNLIVAERSAERCICSADQGGYVLSGTPTVLSRNRRRIARGRVGSLPFVEQPVRIFVNDLLVLTNSFHTHGLPAGLPYICCTLPEILRAAKAGQPIFLDDGKIEGVIRDVRADWLLVEITRASPAGAKIGSEKGINLPETVIDIPALTQKDCQDLDFIAEHADLVGMSFVRRPEDVLNLQRELNARDKADLGVVLKIESRQAFESLPRIMMAALRNNVVGVMVARGDLAVEIGFERLAEVQEEVLWLTEAAHIPVIWATQVLETLAKTGVPSRAEVTDAAMGVRAECVMLNKGDHILEAVLFLADVLHRMEAHQSKKRSMLRKLEVARVAHH